MLRTLLHAGEKCTCSKSFPSLELRHSGVLYGSANIIRGPPCASGEGRGEIWGDKMIVALMLSSAVSLIVSVFSNLFDTFFLRLEKDNLYIHSEHINRLYVHLRVSHSEERQTREKNGLTCLHNWNGFFWDYDERNGNTYYCFFHQYLHHLARVAFLPTAATAWGIAWITKHKLTMCVKKMENKTREAAACEDVGQSCYIL